MVSAQGVHVNPKKIEAVRTWKTPENVKELQQFLGFANYYNRFVPQYAKIAAPLANLLKKNTPYKWEPKHQEAVEQLKQALTSAPVLILPDPERDYVIEADTSDQAMGAVLMQDQGNGLQPIAYLSKKLHGAKLNYLIHDKEALAIVIAFKAWRCYLKGRRTTVYTDHCSLKYLKTQPNLSRRQVRWIDFLETHFHYDIVYKPGHKNKADALSRPAHVAAIHLEGMNPLLKGLFTHGYATDPKIPLAEKRHLLQVPSRKRRDYCSLFLSQNNHGKWLAWTSSPGYHLPRAVMTPSLSSLTSSPKWDTSSRHTTARTEETAQLFVRYIISQYSIPTTLISDRDPKFTSKFWKELMSLLGTKLAMSSAYHPQTDGQTERLNQIVEQLLRAACMDEISKWDLHLPVLEFAYNNATHAATRQTQFFLCYGRHPLTPQKPTASATLRAHGAAAISIKTDGVRGVAEEVRLITREKNHPPELLAICRPHTVHPEERRRVPNVHRLQSTEPGDHQVALPYPAHRQTDRPTSQSSLLLENRLTRGLPSNPYNSVHVTKDFVTGLPTKDGCNDAIFVVVDKLTKMAHFTACKKNISAEETACLFISTVVCLHGIPSAIVSDRDTKFTSDFLRNLWEWFGTRLQFSSAYHPETDGQTERANPTMEQLIRATCDDWEQQLPLIEFAYNNATSATT
ncbi:hypothetical protein CLOM_g18142 [Closterium sp. NIES-68]|nr:hypothetical protein CLOM_g18142 [Closterium sp. NIES-68]